MYRGYSDHRIKATNQTQVTCLAITDPRRQEWCQQSGMTTDPTQAAPGNILVTPGINVIGRAATSLSIDWPRTPTSLPEHRNRQFFHNLLLRAKDTGDVAVTAGPDSGLRVNVSARTVELGNEGPVELCDGVGTSGLLLDAGVARFSASVCGIHKEVILTFEARSTAGLLLTVETSPFDVVGAVPVAIMLPEAATADPLDLDYRMWVCRPTQPAASPPWKRRAPHAKPTCGGPATLPSPVRVYGIAHSWKQLLGRGAGTSSPLNSRSSASTTRARTRCSLAVSPGPAGSLSTLTPRETRQTS